MSRLVSGITWAYTKLLRLYPPGFRAEFADEMREVFTLAVEETDDALALLDLLIGELRDLPFSVIRARIQERRQNTNHVLDGGVMVASGISTRTFRLCMRATLAGIVIYTLIVVMPFFMLGIHLQPADRVAAGFFDPTNLPLYGGEVGRIYGNIFWMATILVLLFTPILEVVLGSILCITLLRNRTLFPQKQRIVGSVAALAAISLVLFAVSSFGRLLLAWWLD